MIKFILRFEYLLFFFVSLFLFLQVGGNMIVFLLTLLLLDISAVGYLINPKIGAIIYNLFHNYILGFTMVGLGVLASMNLWVLAGLMVIAHVSMDRFFGFGLKYPDRFKHTHLDG